jgi:hypothetical protein
MKEFAINEALANEILQYLSKQPYLEVVGMINRLSQLNEVTIQKSDNKGSSKPELVPSTVIARGE